jgi:hypothetical protein
MEGLDCARPEQQDLVARYVGGRLGEAEAQAFEAHYFGCERCWAEVQAAAEIREAKGFEVFAEHAAARPRAGPEIWTLLAAAAALAVMVLGLNQLAEMSEVSRPAAVLRSTHEEPLSLRARPGAAGRVVLEWTPHPDAQAYAVEIFASDGTTVWEKETSETAVTVDAEVLSQNRPGISFVATVEALDMSRQSVGQSQRIGLPH